MLTIEQLKAAHKAGLRIQMLVRASGDWITLVYPEFLYGSDLYRIHPDDLIKDDQPMKKGTPHKHAEMIKTWADGATIQVLVRGEWKDSANPSWFSKVQYRVKPETITVNGISVPVPLRQAQDTSDPHSTVYIVSLASSCLHYAATHCSVNLVTWDRGLVHKTAEAAVAHAKAMLANNI